MEVCRLKSRGFGLKVECIGIYIQVGFDRRLTDYYDVQGTTLESAGNPV